MKKYDELLKKVEMYEKLAVYGNRKEFLQSLGQGRPFMGTTNKDYQITDPSAPNYLDPRNLTPSQKQYWQDQAAKKVKPFNAQELDQWAAGLGRPKPEEAEAPRLQQWQKDWASLPTPQQPHDAAEQAYWAEKAKGTTPGAAVPTSSAPPVARSVVKSNPTVQKAQLQLINHEGIGVGPSGADGKLGPDTIKALHEYANKIGVPSLSIADAVKALSGAYKAPAAETPSGVYNPSLGF